MADNTISTVVLGKKVKNFKAASSAGEDFQLKDYKGKKVVIYFYPKDSTPGCTTESIEFNESLAKFKKLNTEIIGVSRDSLKSHDKFICKYDLKFPLLSDEDESVCKMFDVIKEKTLYGKKFMGIERSTFIIDEDQKLAAEFRKVKAQGHAQEILDYIKQMD